MNTEVRPLVLEDGVDTVLTLVGSSQQYLLTAVDIQSTGVLYEFVDASLGPRRVFRPWASVGTISQAVT